MPTTIPVVKPISKMQLAPGSLATIPNITWQEFEAILQELGENRAARVAYCHETLEIMVPLPEHEKPKEIISDIIKTLLKAKKQRYESLGSTTFKQDNIAGIEPDACFYIQNYQQMIGQRQLELGDPPPDLAVEIDVTSKTALDAYQALRCPEVWIYSRRQLNIFLLQDGQYVESQTSPHFSDISLTQWIPKIVERSWQVGSSQALEEFETTLKNNNLDQKQT
jgi:Uma2 family endonuclease